MRCSAGTSNAGDSTGMRRRLPAGRTIARHARRAAVEERLDRRRCPRRSRTPTGTPTASTRGRTAGARHARRRPASSALPSPLGSPLWPARRREIPHFRRLPPRAEQRQAAERDQAADDVDQLGADVVAPQELHDRERAAADQHRRPHAAQPRPPAHRDDQPRRHDQRHDRQLPAGHRAEQHRPGCR